MRVEPFDHEYRPGRLLFGEGCVRRLGEVADDTDVSRALVVCGRNVGSNRAVMEPLTAGLGPRFAGVFDNTSPEKTLETVREGVERVRADRIDGLVAVGGGSSIDIATVISALEAEGEPVDDLFVSADAEGKLVVPELDAEKLPVIAVPTTLAGADITCGAGIYLNTGETGDPTSEVRGGAIYNPKLMPRAVLYDPALLATTPRSVLFPSAMNGFDHGIEVLYSRRATPITDATASRGLSMLRTALPKMANDPADTDALGRGLVGTALCTYGLAPDPESSKISIVHAFGHVISRHYDIQQGAVHGIVAPHVLEYVFDSMDARRDELAAALGSNPSELSEAETADSVVDTVTEIRDALDLPRRLQDIPALTTDHFDAIAEGVVADIGIERGPPELSPDSDDVRTVLEHAW